MPRWYLETTARQLEDSFERFLAHPGKVRLDGKELTSGIWRLRWRDTEEGKPGRGILITTYSFERYCETVQRAMASRKQATAARVTVEV